MTILEYRTAHGLSQRDMGQVLGKSQSQVQRMEKRKDVGEYGDLFGMRCECKQYRGHRCGNRASAWVKFGKQLAAVCGSHARKVRA